MSFTKHLPMEVGEVWINQLIQFTKCVLLDSLTSLVMPMNFFPNLAPSNYFKYEFAPMIMHSFLLLHTGHMNPDLNSTDASLILLALAKCKKLHLTLLSPTQTHSNELSIALRSFRSNQKRLNWSSSNTQVEWSQIKHSICWIKQALYFNQALSHNKSWNTIWM